MLGDFITRGLMLVLGFAYPAFECFKTIEKNRVEIEELRFWCQYWIIVAVLTVFERIADIFVSWLPMYGEMKLALFIYLWYPKTKGTGFVYDTLLKPYVTKHETDIDKNLQEARARVWDLAIYYWQNCTEIGQTTFFQIFEFFVSQASKIRNITSSERTGNREPIKPLPSPPIAASPFRRGPPNKNKQSNRSVAQSPNSNSVQVHLQNQTEYIHTEDKAAPESVSGPSSADESDSGLDKQVEALRLRLRRFKGSH